ncbi:phage head-binding domain-containing protein [Escherichia coli]|uniref:phage head-binding domain-containing protein n=1 Tax=Escherichia coli TaxID=562 RepID=UPI00044B891E|nr:phage head-binding domain-containing protein [Escherichia coli]QOC59583.1 hypothetical protein Kapi1_067 [Escherichia phage vB_EcoP_Kapi1]EWY54963.1 hypothetical protein K427_02995 [Escherichia coli MP1]OCJ81737.1 hypothetical protein BCF76_19800 [Escherichia coli]OCJ82719.1 hypothetical protein BCF76_25110 [Escherichia coli]OCJ87825.1 hypothetical protein BCF76_01230 [Escherichia coli]
MPEQLYNVVVSQPSQLFTLARSFKANANGKIYIGKIDTDPVNPENQIQVYVENEDGSHVPVSQPIIINAAGYPVYNGQIAKFVTVQGHSMAVYDAYGAQQFYFPNVLKYDPDQLDVRLSSPYGTSYIHHNGENAVDVPLNKYLAWRNGDISAFGGKYNDSASGDLNKSAFAEMESTFGGVRLNLMGKSVYIPDEMNLQVSNIEIWGGGNIMAGAGYAFFLKEGGSVTAKNFHIEGVSSDYPRLVGSIQGVAYKIKDISYSHFTTKGRVILFAGLGNTIYPAVNPEVTGYGCNSVKISHFHSESPVDYIVSLQDFPFSTLEVANFTVHNMAGTFINAGITNENPYERQLQRAMELVSIHDYTVENEDSFWADGNYAYTTIGVCECWNLNHYNGTQRGVKVRNSGNSYYDLYNGSHLVAERDITVVDGYVWNDWHLSPHKIKNAYQYTSQNKRWYYTRDYIARIKALFPGVDETKSTGSFFYPETQDWHNETTGPLEYGNRFIHIDNCDIELIRLGLVHGNAVNTNIRITNNHFSSLSTLRTNFMQVANYPYNIYQQITFKDNRLDLPKATVSGILKMLNGGEAGGGGFTGVVDISGNVGRFDNLIVFDDFTTVSSLYANMMLSLRNNDFVSTTNCYLTGDGVQTSQFDASVCDKNFLSGASVKIGALWNTQGRIEVGAVINSFSPVILFDVGIPTTMNVATGDRYINIDNGSSGVRVIKFTISKDANSTSITFTDGAGTQVTKKTGTDNGTFSVNVGASAGFAVNCIVSSTGVSIQTASSLRQRFIISGYTV